MRAFWLVIEGSPRRVLADGNPSVDSHVADQHAGVFPLITAVESVRSQISDDGQTESPSVSITLANDSGQCSSLFGGTIAGFERPPPIGARAELHSTDGEDDETEFADIVQSISLGRSGSILIAA